LQGRGFPGRARRGQAGPAHHGVPRRPAGHPVRPGRGPARLAAPGAVSFPSTTPIAVVGTAVRAPGGIAGPAAFWAAVTTAQDLIGELPADRRDRFGAAWDGMVTRGGYLEAPFD